MHCHMDSLGASEEGEEMLSLQVCTNANDLTVPTRENASVVLNYQNAVPSQAALLLGKV